MLDLFMDLPKEPENSFLAKHIEKMDESLNKMFRAAHTRDLLTKSYETAEYIRQIAASDKAGKQKGSANGDFQPPYLMINKNMLASGPPRVFEKKLDAHNERAQRQDELERRLVAQLGERYKHAKLLEVSEGSYLIQNQIKLPVFGKTINPHHRTKDSISKNKFLRSMKSPVKEFKLDQMSKAIG